jgi:hypothetical protein
MSATQIPLDFQRPDAPAPHRAGAFLAPQKPTPHSELLEADAGHLCPDCTWHQLSIVRGMWRCPGCNP